MIDFNAVNEERIVDGRKRLWFDSLRDKERKRLADYMEKNNYKIAPGSYGIYYGSKLEDLKKELVFEKIEETQPTEDT
ncbi:MAG: hypothetical protein GXY43_06655 [Clostridiaceae bacterium]|nr:hypothetical protein [Clostridiaceae bacterium]